MAASCSESSARHHGHDLLRREDLDVDAPALDGLLEVAHRVQRQPVGLAGPLHDAEEDGHDLDLRAVAQRPAGAEPRAPVLAVGDRDVLDRDVAEDRQQVRAQDRAVVAQRRGPALVLVAQPLQVLLAGLGEGHPRAHHARQRPRARLAEDVAQPLLGRPARQRALRRVAATELRGADALLDLPAVCQAVRRVPDRPAPALAQVDVAGRLPRSPHAR